MTPYQHYQLLLRPERSVRLKQIVQQQIQQGMRVLDAGCGSGLLAIWAAQRGAEVTAVDFADLELAARLAEENGVSSQIRFIRSDLNELKLDHGPRYDALLAMVYLNDPRRDRSAHDMVFGLRDRLLTADAAMVPDSVRYKAYGVQWPEQALSWRSSNLANGVRALECTLELKLSELHSAMMRTPSRDQFPERGPNGLLARDRFTVLTESATYAEVRYKSEPPSWPTNFSMRATATGTLDAIVFVQDLCFAGQVVFSNESVSWLRSSTPIESGQTCCVSVEMEHWLRENLLTAIVN